MRTSALLERTASGEIIAAPVAVVVAHPDDEIIGAGTRLRQFQHLSLIYVTDGAPRDLRDASAHGFTSAVGYAAARRRELEDALRVADAAPDRVVELEVPDQQASLNLVHITRGVRAILAEVRPHLVLTHPYEGGHPDHDACAFAVHNAIAGDIELAEFTSYHDADGSMRTAEFLPSTGEHVYTIRLTNAERERKRSMLDAFRTQRGMLAAFRTDVESFRLAPAYDFIQVPHDGTLYYERQPWGMTGDRFRELVREAQSRLTVEAAA
jgi:LmbE family N-acetylglucosaminyl deacetylase